MKKQNNMKNLNQFIRESLLDDEEVLLDKGDEFVILKFIVDHYLFNKNEVEIDDIKEKCTLKKKGNKFIVDVMGTLHVKMGVELSLNELANDIFEFGEVAGSFIVVNCPKLKTLEGGPKKVGGTFRVDTCNLLKDLVGGPEEVEDGYYCTNCLGLKSFKGAPKKIDYDFIWEGCPNIKDLKHHPKKAGNVVFDKKSGFTKEDIKKVCDVKYEIAGL